MNNENEIVPTEERPPALPASPAVPVLAATQEARPEPAPPPPGQMVAVLLKSPETVAGMIAGDRSLGPSSLVFLVWGLLAHAVFGFALGFFGGWQVAVMDAVKAPLVAVCALLLCFPSLYVFACVAGLPLTLSQAFSLGCAILAMFGLLLVGLAPVTWLFAVSTASIPFMVILTLLVWIVAAVFAARLLEKLRAAPFFEQTGGIKVWFFVLILVTFQMTTAMRPFLTPPQAGWWTAEKKFFLTHFKDAMKD